MEELTIDTGLRSYRINGGAVLRMNPADPNLYHRFLLAGEKLEAIQTELADKAQNAGTGAEALGLLARADAEAKQLLDETFGGGNRFDEILQGVNLMAVCENGERAVTNLLAALTGILEEGAHAFYESAAAPELEAQARRHD